MLKRVAALLMVLLFASQALADGIVCGVDLISDAIGDMGEAACPMRSAGGCDKMACCARGKSPTGARVAMICCEVKCGESTGGAQFNFAPLTLALARPIIAIRFAPLDTLNEAETAALSLRSAKSDLLHHDPPDLFLQNSALLI